jgi:transposase
LGKIQLRDLLKGAAKRLHRNKAATALANKLARITWSMLRNGKTFDITYSEVEAV